MKEVLSWIVEHYELLILVGACLLDIVLFLFGVFKKKSQSPLDIVLKAAPYYIRAAEEFIGAEKGADKKAFVMKYLLKTYKNLTGVDLGEHSVTYDELDRFVEDILRTPQKKGK